MTFQRFKKLKEKLKMIQKMHEKSLRNKEQRKKVT